MDPISIVSVLDLAAKFENLHRLLHEGGGEGKLNNNFSAELASRLDLWSTDVCGESRAHDETPSHVLRVIEDADPGSSLVKALHDDFDQLQSIVDKSKTGANLTEERLAQSYDRNKLFSVLMYGSLKALVIGMNLSIACTISATLSEVSEENMLPPLTPKATGKA